MEVVLHGGTLVLVGGFRKHCKIGGGGRRPCPPVWETLDANYSLKCFFSLKSYLKLIPHFISMLPSILAAATKANKIICLPIKSSRKTLKYYKLTKTFKFICCKVQECLMHANSISMIHIMFSFMFKIKPVTTAQTKCIIFWLSRMF